MHHVRNFPNCSTLDFESSTVLSARSPTRVSWTHLPPLEKKVLRIHICNLPSDTLSRKEITYRDMPTTTTASKTVNQKILLWVDKTVE